MTDQLIFEGAIKTVLNERCQEYRREVVVNFVRAAIEDALANQPDVEISFEDAKERADA